MDHLTAAHQALSHHHSQSRVLAEDARRCCHTSGDVLPTSSVTKTTPPHRPHREPEGNTVQLSTCSQCGCLADQTYLHLTRPTDSNAREAPVKRSLLSDQVQLLHHTESYSQNLNHNHYYCQCSRKFHGETQVVVPRRCLLLVLTLLLLLLLLLLVLVVPDSGNDEDSMELQASGYLEVGDGGPRRVSEHTASLLPALAVYYHSHAITIHQPDNYDIGLDQQSWHFKLVQRYKTMPSIDILLHTSVEKCRLIVCSGNGSKTIYNLSYFKNARQNSSKDTVGKENIFNFENNMITTTTGEWRVTDVTKYLTDWLLDFSELSVEFETSTLFPDVRQINPLPQPVLCVHEYNTQQSRESDRIKTTLKHFMASKMELITRNYLSLSDNGAITLATGYQRIRRGTSGECQMSRVLVSMEELGLHQVVYPINIKLKFCLGSCHVLDHPTIFSTNALLRAKFKFQEGSSQVPSPHCTPIRYQYQTFFVWQEDRLQKINVSDLDVSVCGCR
ncbi:uncharacterized protein [Procambarus clarkii]|uniref:uncharacterized protein isoform X2 n=1 Tax=Procambarus clarkii TaxID=6728 RepID=UPI003742A108